MKQYTPLHDCLMTMTVFWVFFFGLFTKQYTTLTGIDHYMIFNCAFEVGYDNFGLRKKLFRMNVLRCFVFVCPRFVMDIIILTIKKMASNAFAFVDGYST